MKREKSRYHSSDDFLIRNPKITIPVVPTDPNPVQTLFLVQQQQQQQQRTHFLFVPFYFRTFCLPSDCYPKTLPSAFQNRTSAYFCLRSLELDVLGISSFVINSLVGLSLVLRAALRSWAPDLAATNGVWIFFLPTFFHFHRSQQSIPTMN